LFNYINTLPENIKPQAIAIVMSNTTSPTNNRRVETPISELPMIPSETADTVPIPPNNPFEERIIPINPFDITNIPKAPIESPDSAIPGPPSEAGETPSKKKTLRGGSKRTKPVNPTPEEIAEVLNNNVTSDVVG
jgi:hypothetical protein